MEDDRGPPVQDIEYVTAFQNYLLQYYLKDLESLLLEVDDTIHYGLQISYPALSKAPSYELIAQHLLLYPGKLLPLFDEGIRAAQMAVISVDDEREGQMCVKDQVHARLTLDGSDSKLSIGKIRSNNIGTLVAVVGTIIRTGAVKMLEGEREYECNKCKHRFKLTPQLEENNVVRLPNRCPSERTKACKSGNFRFVPESTNCVDYQELKVQEPMQALGVGAMPRSILVILEHDLVDICKAGDDVEVTGIVACKWRPVSKDARCDLELVIKAVNLRKTNQTKAPIDLSEAMIARFEDHWAEHKDCPLQGRNSILKSVCPQVFGLYTVKLAVMLTLIGGVQRVDQSGTKIRGESHLLIVGDPGTGKSQFLKYAAKLISRSVVTTGLGSTSAGLTVTAVKDGGEWILEAGALVLADGGLCCIDEFDSIRESDRGTIHEAMEQQTLSVAKAGLVTTLNTRTTVFGVCNPKGTYDPTQTLSVNCALSGPLLSRFDIVLVLLDTKNKTWDSVVSEHILGEHQKRQEDEASNSNAWDLSTLRSYIYYVKAAFQPTLTPEAEEVIKGYYQLQRRLDSGTNAARVTIRMLESLVRLAQAHARLMFRNEVLRMDAVAAVIAVEASMTTSALLDNMTNALHSTFKQDPDRQYAEQEAVILHKLGLGVSSSTPSVPRGVDPPEAPLNTQPPRQTRNSQRADYRTLARHRARQEQLQREREDVVGTAEECGQAWELHSEKRLRTDSQAQAETSDGAGSREPEGTRNTQDGVQRTILRSPDDQAADEQGCLGEDIPGGLYTVSGRLRACRETGSQGQAVASKGLQGVQGGQVLLSGTDDIDEAMLNIDVEAMVRSTPIMGQPVGGVSASQAQCEGQLGPTRLAAVRPVA